MRDWLPFRILICLFVLLLAGLASTGVILWWRKRNVARATA
jgi:uncharacterized iron-regulated membrane protein